MPRFCSSCTRFEECFGPAGCCGASICMECELSGMGSLVHYTCVHCKADCCPMCSDFADRVGKSKNRLCWRCCHLNACGPYDYSSSKKAELHLPAKKDFFDYFPK